MGYYPLQRRVKPRVHCLPPQGMHRVGVMHTSSLSPSYHHAAWVVTPTVVSNHAIVSALLYRRASRAGLSILPIIVSSILVPRGAGRWTPGKSIGEGLQFKMIYTGESYTGVDPFIFFFWNIEEKWKKSALKECYLNWFNIRALVFVLRWISAQFQCFGVDESIAEISAIMRFFVA